MIATGLRIEIEPAPFEYETVILIGRLLTQYRMLVLHNIHNDVL